MKRTPLARRTTLARGAVPLARNVPLSRRTAMPRQPAQRVHSRRTAHPVPQDTRETVRGRSGGRCEVGTSWCTGTAQSQHHRLPRRMGGSTAAGIHSAANLLDVCGDGVRGCHGFIEAHRSIALEQGWLLHAGQDPATVPAVVRGRRLLLADTYTETSAA